MRKFAFLAAALAFASAAFATEYVRVVRPIPAETNAVVSVSFGGAAVTPVAFRVLGDAGTNTAVSVSLVSNTLGYETTTALVGSTNVTGSAVAISASGYAQTAYPGDRLAFTVANTRKETGAVVVWAQK